MTRSQWAALAAIAVVWCRVCGADWFWDDHALIVNNPALADIDLAAVLHGDLWAGSGRASSFFRPLASLSFAFDRVAANLDPRFAHLHSLGWHLLATGLLGALAAPRVGPTGSVVTMLVFGMHPIQSEAVVWVSARNDLMCAAFCFAALHAADRRGTLLLPLCAAAAALSKEAGFMLPFLLMGWRLVWRERAGAAELLGLTTGLAAAWILRMGAALAPVQLLPIDPLVIAGAPARMLASPLAWIAVPWPLTSTASLYQAAPGFGAVFAAILAVCALGALARPHPTAWPWALLLWSALAGAPALVAVAATHGLGERFLYLPLAGVALLVGLRPISPLVAVPVLAAWFGVVQVRLTDWKEEARMWESAATRAPDSWSLFGAAVWREAHGDPKGALAAYRAAALSTPRFPPACAQGVRLLASVDAHDLARALAGELTAAGCSGTEFEQAQRALDAPGD